MREEGLFRGRAGRIVRGWRRRLRAAIVLAALLCAARVPASTLAPGFAESVVFSGLTQPTVVRFAADGRVFVAEKSGIIKVFDSLTATTPTIFADLRTEVHDFWDRGLLGLALAPSFPSTPWVYVLYTLDAPIGGTPPVWGTPDQTSDGCPSPPGATTNGCVVSGRLARLQAAGDVMVPGSEQVLINNWCQQFPSHSMGTLAFGADGALYLSAGEGASFTQVDYGQFGWPQVNACGDPPVGLGGTETAPTARGGSLRSQNLGLAGYGQAAYSGKILRVDPDTGAAPPDNPLHGSPVPGADRIIAAGFRNPFRFTIRPGTTDLWIADVGWNTWEEIDRIPAPTLGVQNFGWPCFEGPAPESSWQQTGLAVCASLYGTPGATTAPYYAYNHADHVVANDGCAPGSSSITGIAFYPGGFYPPTYDGALFFADYSRGCIWTMFPSPSGDPDPGRLAVFASGAAGPVDLETGPGGDLFYVDVAGGTIRRIQAMTNGPPAAVIAADVTSGRTPLTVHFDGSGSHDPQGLPLTYSWDLNGDGVYGDATLAMPSYTYDTPGTYTVGLQVTDAQGMTGTATLAVRPGTTAPTVSIAAPAAGTTWNAGDTIAFAGSAVDAQDGPLPDSALTWTVILHHCPSTCHTHLIQSFTGIASGSVVAPDHDYPSYLELQLAATNSRGLSSTQSVLLYPDTVTLTFATDPTGLLLAVGAAAAVTPFTRTVIVGSSNSVTAPSPQDAAGAPAYLQTWSDGGAPSHSIVAPAAPATYVATYGPAPLGALPSPWAEQDVGTPAAAGSAGYQPAGGTFTVSGSGADIWGTADAFHYVFEPLAGDGAIVARVATQGNTDPWAKAGVMIRQDLSAGSPHAMMIVTPGNGVAFQRRLVAGGPSTSTGVPGPAAPTWVRLVRSATTLSGYVSNDGIAWTPIDGATIAMTPTVYVGLAVTSHDDGVLGSATFDGVALAGGLPTTTTSTTTTTTPPTVATTLPPPGGGCGPCAAGCCGATLPLALRALRIVPRGDGLARVRLQGVGGSAAASFAPRQEATGVQIADGQGSLLCVAIPSDRWSYRGHGRYVFRDRDARLAGGLDRGALTRTHRGTVAVTLQGTRVPLRAPAGGGLAVTIRVGDQCRRVAVPAGVGFFD